MSDRLESGNDFAPVARRLAGLAGWHLGWSADAFWRATPDEMEVVVAAMLGRDGADIASPPTRGEVTRLMESFPDG